jgi:hypothetical protein
MDTLQCFGAYAQDFELTFKDDDWSRLARHFAPDATYEVSEPFACRLRGPDAIFAGIKKSLDGFDRRFATRDVALDGPPLVEGDTVRLSWSVTYGRPGNPPLVLRGHSSATVADGVIVRLADSYDARAVEVVADWLAAYGKDLDPSYV